MEYIFHHLMSTMNSTFAGRLYIKADAPLVQSQAHFRKVPKGSRAVSRFQMIPIYYIFLFTQFILYLFILDCYFIF